MPEIGSLRKTRQISAEGLQLVSKKARQLPAEGLQVVFQKPQRASAEGLQVVPDSSPEVVQKYEQDEKVLAHAARKGNSKH